MDIKAITKTVSTVGGKALKMKTGHKIAIGVATAVTAAAAGTAIAKKQQAKRQERSVKSLVIEDAARMLPLPSKKPADFEKALEESAKPFALPEQVRRALGLTELDELTDKLMEYTDERKINFCLPSLRIDNFNLELAKKVQKVRKTCSRTAKDDLV